MASNIRNERWAMGLGIRAGKALLRAEDALGKVQATAVGSDFDTIASLRAARCELNRLARDISRLVDELIEADERRHGT